MTTTQPSTTCADLEGMNTEEFLAWLLNNCAMDDEEKKVARHDVTGFLIVETVRACFDVEVIEKRYPNLLAWTEKESEPS